MSSLIPENIFKGYDIRAIYPSEINEENIIPIIKAIYTFLHKDKRADEPLTLVVGTDMRVSSPSLTKIAVNTLVELGAHVVDIGIVSTPTFYFAVNHYDYEAGIQITASHNPKEYNGVKIIKNTPKGLLKIGRPTGLEDIKALALKGESVSAIPGGFVEKKNDILEEEVQNSLKITDHPKIKELKIVADPANAMGATYIEALFKHIPGELIKMNFELDGTFPAHQPDPLQAQTLVDLQKRILSEKADLGLAPDGDGDRLFFIDEKGQIVPATIITSIVAKELISKHPGETVLVDIRYQLTPQKILDEIGGKLLVTKVGHAYITESLNESGGIFAGESSAHYYFRETGGAESQMPVILFVLEVLSRENIPMSELVEKYRRSCESGEFNFEVHNTPEILDAVVAKYSDGRIGRLDGISIDYPTWRLSLRTSNTEPLLRLNLESLTREEMEQKRDEVIGVIKKLSNGR